MTKAEIAAHLIATGYGADKPEVLAAVADLAKKNKVTVPAAAPAVAETSATETEAAPL